MSSLPADARSSLDAAVNQIGKNINGVGRCQQRRGFVRSLKRSNQQRGVLETFSAVPASQTRDIEKIFTEVRLEL